MAKRMNYTERMAEKDAGRILTEIMHRKNFGPIVAEELAQELQRIVKRELFRPRVHDDRNARNAKPSY